MTNKSKCYSYCWHVADSCRPSLLKTLRDFSCLVDFVSFKLTVDMVSLGYNTVWRWRQNYPSKVCVCLQVYVVLQPRRPTLISSPLWEPHTSFKLTIFVIHYIHCIIIYECNQMSPLLNARKFLLSGLLMVTRGFQCFQPLINVSLTQTCFSVHLFQFPFALLATFNV
jgi:hypothetical protein